MGGFSGGDMSATRQTKDAPPLKIYEHSRTGFRTLDGSAPYENDPEGIALEGSVDLIQYSHDGEYAAIYVGEEMTIYRTADGQTVSSFHHAKIKMIAFSPQKEAGGTELNDQEKEKVGGEADLRAELKSL